MVDNFQGQDQDYNTVGNNRLQSDGTHAYLYDKEGNRKAKFIDTNGDTEWTSNESGTEYTWDHRNRLVKVVTKNAQGEITQSVEYKYDALDQMIKRTLDSDGELGGTPVEQTFFLYEMGQIALQFDKTDDGDLTASNLSHRYLWGPAVDQLLADEQVTSLSSPGETYWMMTDHLGSVRDVVDSSGRLRIHRQFDSFGNIVGETHYNASGTVVTEGQAGYVDEAFAYTGKYFDTATGLQNNLFRWYDPEVGRWNSGDPIGFLAGDANLNRYVGNEPTSWIDPLGLADGLPGGGAQGEEGWRERRRKLGEVDPWWNDSGWDWLNPFAYTAGIGDWVGKAASSLAYIDTDFESNRQVGQAWYRNLAEDPKSKLDPREQQRIGSFAETTIEEGAEGYYQWAAGGGAAGVVRNSATKRAFLRSLADDYRTAAWMKPWLRKGKVPPGYQVDHIKPLSIGGADAPSNMRLQSIDLHIEHHRRYRPWENR